MKNAMCFLSKLIISGILALVILSGFCLVYSNTPMAVEQPENITNYKFGSNVYWSAMTEGFGFGKTNTIGYNSRDDVDYSDTIIAFLGSSQTEAFQVPQNRNFVSLTQEKLFCDSDPRNDIPCLNLGISSHYFNVSVSHLENFSDTFENTPYVVIEMRSLMYTENEFDKMMNNEFHDPHHNKGFVYSLLRKIPYIRTLKAQYEKVQRKDAPKAEENDVDYAVYEKKLDAVIEKIASIGNENDFHIIVLYHNTVKVDAFNNVRREDDAKLLEIFEKCCAAHEVSFVDVTDDFVAHYQRTYQMPYGFWNTTMGTGHLNTTGHRIIADAVYTEICRLSEGAQNVWAMIWSEISTYPIYRAMSANSGKDGISACLPG